LQCFCNGIYFFINHDLFFSPDRSENPFLICCTELVEVQIKKDCNE